MSSSASTTPANYEGGGGGGIRDIGTVTSGMAIMNFDQKTKPYTRNDLVQFLMHYQENLNEEELRLVEKGIVGTFAGMPAFFGAGYFLSGRFGWHRVVRVMAPLNEGGRPSWFVTHLPKIGRTAFGLTAATIPYMAVQQWFVSRVLELDERESNLSFHVRRLMLSQRSGMMFKRTATREVTKEEQQRFLREAEAHVNENRSGQRVSQGLGTGPVDVNLQLGQQVLTPVAQTGYKPMPTQQR
ncbi:conserved hypothetical protein [Leishmania major strain Friedlin]|uniref:Uncharacterized protein n=1 Tax=Leishmania major TaxID=5664 RepID=Q4Q4U3_LEIMA|nr:conserved hypothetical protein [Leishmania major strain Friedlin]CAG9580473.1 hypothetical_protein_-_conserved [Leishmania major strain Friedlin]CAJ08860.1 conserved hypothetical protein [Leishmania major strain Friedlin]|eukprot:XP_001685655.1 conserved hypothetical protein [Leishmania major strain Friedlin]